MVRFPPVLVHHSPLVKLPYQQHTQACNIIQSSKSFFRSILPRHTHFSHLTRIFAPNFLKCSIHPYQATHHVHILTAWASIRYHLHRLRLLGSHGWHHPMPKPTDALAGGAGHRRRPLANGDPKTSMGTMGKLILF